VGVLRGLVLQLSILPVHFIISVLRGLLDLVPLEKLLESLFLLLVMKLLIMNCRGEWMGLIAIGMLLRGKNGRSVTATITFRHTRVAAGRVPSQPLPLPQLLAPESLRGHTRRLLAVQVRAHVFVQAGPVVS
jgi:hypothetical protein